MRLKSFGSDMLGAVEPRQLGGEEREGGDKQIQVECGRKGGVKLYECALAIV